MAQDLEFLKKGDLYELFDILPEATEAEIKKAYRKKALKYHPDKNPDNAQAKETFQQLSKALEVLTDEKARATYDNILKAKRERELKYRQLDAKRRKLKTELENREKLAQVFSEIDEEENLKREIERIRKEGSKQLEEQNILLQKELEKKLNQVAVNRIKIKRKGKFVITEDLVRKQFSTFGTIHFVVVSKNNKSAVLEFENYQSLERIAASCPENFTFQIININKNDTASSDLSNDTPKPEPTATAAAPSVNLNSFDDYEDFILKRLQAKAKQTNSTA